MAARRAAILAILTFATAACGPTSQELNAHGTEVAGSIFETQTAQATRASTTPTLSPTTTPTPTQRPSDLVSLEQELAFRVLTLDDFPEGFEQSTTDVQNLLKRGLKLLPFQVERIFGFRNKPRTELVAGLHVLLPSESERVEFDQNLAVNTQQFLMEFTLSNEAAFQDIEPMPAPVELGDAIAAYTAVSQIGGSTFRFSIIGYRRGVIGLWISLTHLDGEDPQVSLIRLVETIDSHIAEKSESVSQYYGHMIQEWTDAIEASPEDSNLYYLRGKIYYTRYETAYYAEDPRADQTDFLKAIEDFTRAIELNPGNAHAYYMRGLARAAYDQTEAALEDYKLAIVIDPGLASTYYARAFLFEEIGEFDLAVIDYLRFLELNTDPHWRAEVERRLANLQEGRSLCESHQRTLVADAVFGGVGSESIEFFYPRGVAVTREGDIYVADSANHRIQHLSPDGELLDVWGRFASVLTGEAPGGAFNEPWGVAVSADGIYVADTWNHRIQQFTATGEFIRMYGTFGTGETAFHFWGPRDVAIDTIGRVLVTDTGNKRIVVFDSDGNHVQTISPIGGSGEGRLNEPVGLVIAEDGRLFVADTWNRRVQVFSPDGQPLDQWPIMGWFGSSLANKPYISLDNKGMVFVTDPEGYQVMVFTETGELQYCFGNYGTDDASFGLPIGVAYDHNGGLYITDAENHRLMHFGLGE